MRLFITLILLFTFMSIQAEGKVDYSGHKVLKVHVDSRERAEILSNLQKKSLYDFWNNIHVGDYVPIMSSPEQLRSLRSFLTRHQFEFFTSIEDVQALADLSPMAPPGPKRDPKVGHNMNWTHYHTLEDIYGYFDYLEANFDYVTTEVIGQSYEGRDMRVLKLCTNGCGNKPAMYLDAGIHAREWIAPATATFMLNELTENFDSVHNQDLIDYLDWYFIASVNPDGYEYTWTDDRFWRKTRRPNNNSVCIGTDANRNFDYHWGGEGSTNLPCIFDYRGDKPWSEIEAANIRDFLLSVQDHVKFLDSIHSYGQYILLPWGYTNLLPDNYADQMFVGSKANEALKAVHGTNYKIGNCYDVIYPASGLTIDWAYGAAGIPYSFSMELRDQGEYNFLLPDDQIIPTGEEVWAFHVSVARDMIDLYG